MRHSEWKGRRPLEGSVTLSRRLCLLPGEMKGHAALLQDGILDCEKRSHLGGLEPRLGLPPDTYCSRVLYLRYRGPGIISHRLYS